MLFARVGEAGCAEQAPHARHGDAVSKNKSMRETVAELRSDDAEALLELLELESAVREIRLAAQRLTVAVREIAGEAQQLAAGPSASLDRQHALADYARNVSETAAAHAEALEMLRRGIEAWGI